jgi:hypothetical protein
MQAKLFSSSFLPIVWRGPKSMKDFEKIMQAALSSATHFLVASVSLSELELKGLPRALSIVVCLQYIGVKLAQNYRPLCKETEKLAQFFVFNSLQL